MGKRNDLDGRGSPSRASESSPPKPRQKTTKVSVPVHPERQYRVYSFVESWSRCEGFKSFSIRKSKERGYTWTWKAQIPDGRHVYLHGFSDSYSDALLALDYALEREDWRTDKYA